MLVVSRAPGTALIVLLLLGAGALDLTRCGIVMVTAGHPVPAAGLVVAGLAAAALSLRTARGYWAGPRWAGWAALLIGTMSAPQAAASGFGPPYAIPDIATAAVGILLTVTVLATAGRPGDAGPGTENARVLCPRPATTTTAPRRADSAGSAARARLRRNVRAALAYQTLRRHGRPPGQVSGDRRPQG